MKQEIFNFATINPWSTFFTVVTVVYCLMYAIRSFIDQLENRGSIIILFLIFCSWITVSFFGINELTVWVDTEYNDLLYFLILLLLEGFCKEIYQYNNPNIPKESTSEDD